MPPVGSPGPGIGDPEALLSVTNFFADPRRPFETTIDFATGAFETSSQQGGLQAVLRQLVLDAAVSIGVLNLIFQLGQFCLALNVPRAPHDGASLIKAGDPEGFRR